VIGTEEADLLESGGSITVGTVDAAGVPDASRGWLLQVAPAGDQVRCLVPDHDRQTLDNLVAGARIAVNWVHVLTLESVQLKGRVTSVGPAAAADLTASAAYREAFYAMLHQSDGTPRHLFDQLVPGGYVAVEVAVEELYDQTPGPNAGERR